MVQAAVFLYFAEFSTTSFFFFVPICIVQATLVIFEAQVPDPIPPIPEEEANEPDVFRAFWAENKQVLMSGTPFAMLEFAWTLIDYEEHLPKGMPFALGWDLKDYISTTWAWFLGINLAFNFVVRVNAADIEIDGKEPTNKSTNVDGPTYIETDDKQLALKSWEYIGDSDAQLKFDLFQGINTVMQVVNLFFGFTLSLLTFIYGFAVILTDHAHEITSLPTIVFAFGTMGLASMFLHTTLSPAIKHLIVMTGPLRFSYGSRVGKMTVDDVTFTVDKYLPPYWESATW